MGVFVARNCQTPKSLQRQTTRLRSCGGLAFLLEVAAGNHKTQGKQAIVSVRDWFGEHALALACPLLNLNHKKRKEILAIGGLKAGEKVFFGGENSEFGRRMGSGKRRRNCETRQKARNPAWSLRKKKVLRLLEAIERGVAVGRGRRWGSVLCEPLVMSQ